MITNVLSKKQIALNFLCAYVLNLLFAIYLKILCYKFLLVKKSFRNIIL